MFILESSELEISKSHISAIKHSNEYGALKALK